jgi:hypothetical protein
MNIKKRTIGEKNSVHESKLGEHNEFNERKLSSLLAFFGYYLLDKRHHCL